eukprot:5515016-Pleurochrysis_carterae.AAC.1
MPRTLLLCAIPRYFVVCRGIVRPPLGVDLEFGRPLRCLGALDFKFHKSLKAPALRLTPSCKVAGALSSQREKAFLLLKTTKKETENEAPCFVITPSLITNLKISVRMERLSDANKQITNSVVGSWQRRCARRDRRGKTHPLHE